MQRRGLLAGLAVVLSGGVAFTVRPNQTPAHSDSEPDSEPNTDPGSGSKRDDAPTDDGKDEDEGENEDTTDDKRNDEACPDKGRKPSSCGGKDQGDAGNDSGRGKGAPITPPSRGTDGVTVGGEANGDIITD